MNNKEHLIGRIVKSTIGQLSVVVSDETVDRSGESIPVKSWDLSNFRKSPRMFVNHEYGVEAIVGKWENPRVEGQKLIMDPVFHDLTDRARVTKALVEEGFLDTVSVGFMRKVQKDGSAVNELFEVSFVGVPCNPNARVLTAESLAAVKSFIGEDAEGEAEQASEEKEDEKVEETQQTGEEKTDKKPVEGQEQAGEGEAKQAEKGIIDDTLEAQRETRRLKYAYLDRIWVAFWKFSDAYLSDAVAPEKVTDFVADLVAQLNAIATAGDQSQVSDDEIVQLSVKMEAMLVGRAKANLQAQKAGRVLSSKNRDIIQTSIDSMSSSIETLNALLDATQSTSADDEEKRQDDAASDTEKKGAKPDEDHSKLVKAMKDFDANEEGSSVRLLRIINTATRDALHQANARRG